MQRNGSSGRENGKRAGNCAHLPEPSSALAPPSAWPRESWWGGGGGVGGGMFGGNGSHMLTPDQAHLDLPLRPSGPSSLVQPRAAACLLCRLESFGAARFAFLYRCAAWITGD